MITKPTLFILGAGASIPYGFPSGWELRNKICEAAEGVSSKTVTDLNTALGIPCEDIIEFARNFKKSKLLSIDTFLSKHPKYSVIGKTLIAQQLIPKELDYVLDALLIDDDWYCALWNALAANATSVAELAENKIKILTFNYDRSLERYLHSAISNTFNVSEGEALDALKYFDIQHVYGSLGEFGISNDYSKNIRSYTGTFDRNSVDVAIKCLKVIPEARAEDSIFLKAREAFTWADHVCFLGFGFDPLNVQRLGFKALTLTGRSHEMPVRVVMSAYQSTSGEVDIARDSVLGAYNIRDHIGANRLQWGFCYGTNLGTLREFAWLLR